MSGSQLIHQHQPQISAPRMTPQQYQHQQVVYQHQMQVVTAAVPTTVDDNSSTDATSTVVSSADLSAATIGFSANRLGKTKSADRAAAASTSKQSGWLGCKDS
jgi:hypothetical protein